MLRRRLRKDIVVQRVGEEIILYDPQNGRAHLLDRGFEETPEPYYREMEQQDLLRKRLPRRKALQAVVVAPVLLTLLIPLPAGATCCPTCPAAGGGCLAAFGAIRLSTCCPCGSPDCSAGDICMTTYRKTTASCLTDAVVSVICVAPNSSPNVQLDCVTARNSIGSGTYACCQC